MCTLYLRWRHDAHTPVNEVLGGALREMPFISAGRGSLVLSLLPSSADDENHRCL